MINDFSGEEFDGDISDEELLKILDEKYFIVGISDAFRFMNFLDKQDVSIEEKMIDGFELKELEVLFDKFVDNDLIAVFMPFKLMSSFVKGKNLDNLYTFKPIKGDKKIGILIPCEENRPKRNEVINSNDTISLNEKLSDLENGKISFEDFLGSI